MVNTFSEVTTPDTSWQKIVMKYNKPVLSKSIWQICNSLIPFLALWYLMYKSLDYPYWITLLLAVLASGFLIRMFIIFHDCGHGSFFRSRKANDMVGMFMGILAFTPYRKWHHQHHIHHATTGNLDKRGIGDVWTMTVDEYLKSTKWDRFLYRVFRNPFVLFTFGPVYIVLVNNRFTTKAMDRKEKQNVYFTNIVLVILSVLACFLVGIKAYLLIQMPLMIISHSIGLWLFYIQHQFEDVNWERTRQWDYKAAAISGSSFLKLNPVLQWFTGNIGFHHVHHLSSRIPNYNLSRCHFENDLFKDVKPVKLMDTFKALNLHLWDEQKHRMISFRKIAVQLV